jgi:hypothetical protein
VPYQKAGRTSFYRLFDMAPAANPGPPLALFSSAHYRVGNVESRLGFCPDLRRRTRE